MAATVIIVGEKEEVAVAAVATRIVVAVVAAARINNKHGGGGIGGEGGHWAHCEVSPKKSKRVQWLVAAGQFWRTTTTSLQWSCPHQSSGIITGKHMKNVSIGVHSSCGSIDAALLQMSQIKMINPCWSGSGSITTELQWTPLKRNKQLHKFIQHQHLKNLWVAKSLKQSTRHGDGGLTWVAVATLQKCKQSTYDGTGAPTSLTQLTCWSCSGGASKTEL